MKKKLTCLLFTLSIVINPLMAEKDVNTKKKSPNSGKSVTAECAPANGLEYLNYNNVNALIETGGRMWQDRPNSASAYEVPANSGQTAIFAGSLWMGGTDANDQLKIAAATFGGGTNDFWTGPLTIDGSAEITPDVCTQYDKFFHITRQEVEQFIAYMDCKDNGEGCDAIPEGYKIPRVILEWPAHGDVSLGQDFYLAPFYDKPDKDGFTNGEYNPEVDGDYPYYDLNSDIDCRSVRDVRLFGDDTYWWVFNDKGNIHTETNGQSIGMEIRAQAFAFATNDEVNDMTFYNYELINRSTFTLFNTYFGQWVDPDLGGAYDDFVGCDVERGLGYCYNGDDFDEDSQGQKGYGDRPPSVGVDFFEGPYQDDDGMNNSYGIGPNEALNGLGYYNPNDPIPDTIVDNERFGMRRFVYYNNTANNIGNPVSALDFYNYLRGIWRDGAKMVFGGNGHPSDPSSIDLETDFMFPNNSDPLHWGTKGVDPGFVWTEVTAGNTPFDRRFLQSAGPFTLEPGAVNDITVGVVFARAISGNAEASVTKLFQADSKAQALFDNCFDVLDGPDAPDLSGVELNQEVVLFLTNRKGLSNNFKNYPGDYEEVDPFIIAPEGEIYDNKYRFQGYQIYQVSGPDVSIGDLYDLDRARLAFQCDIEDSITDLTNYYFDEEMNATVPEERVRDASNEGIKTTFRVTEDLFAEGNPKLVNFKTYYFIALAYAHNEFKEYSETPDGLDGQKLPFLPSRKGVSGGISSVSFMPHPQEPKNGGTTINASYGDQPQITRIEGQGNSGLDLAFTTQTLEELVANSLTPEMNFPTYKAGYGPLNVKVVDPTNVSDGTYLFKLYDEDNEYHWKAWREGGNSEDLNDTVYSQSGISSENEQIIDKWGISITAKNAVSPGALLPMNLGVDPAYNNGIIGASMVFKDSSSTWLTGVPDIQGSDDQNWIRSGVASDLEAPDNIYNSYYYAYTPPDVSYINWVGCPEPNPQQPNRICVPIDANGSFENLLGGTWAPFKMTSYTQTDGNGTFVRNGPAPDIFNGGALKNARLEDLQSVDIIITNDQSKWTRCPVIELQEDKGLAIGGESVPVSSLKGYLRQSPSVGKDGTADNSGTIGMGWFPGYAVNLETGERLNMAFGEDSWLGDQNGTDMIWNPTSVLEEGYTPNDALRRPYKKWGGKHYIYVFGNTEYMLNQRFDMPAYDEGEALRKALQFDQKESDVAFAWSTCLWTGIPLLTENGNLLESDVTISLRVEKEYDVYKADTIANNGQPMYEWNMENLSTRNGDLTVAENALSMIRVVPNPYYSFAPHYEQGQLDNMVKITNLPERCQVSIYNVSGTLIRRYDKSDPGTEISWDLKNQSNVPIASGLYLIHVNSPGVGEVIVKWFGVLRPVDLQGF